MLQRKNKKIIKYENQEKTLKNTKNIKHTKEHKK